MKLTETDKNILIAAMILVVAISLNVMRRKSSNEHAPRLGRLSLFDTLHGPSFAISLYFYKWLIIK